ncbi:MAG: hypothetical protein ACRDKY_09590 [Solirubrobacteraceae bacterium]
MCTPSCSDRYRSRIAVADPLDQLSSEELHDLAVRYAARHLDVGFFWRLLEYLPAAEAAAGEIEEAEADALTLRAHLDDLTDSGKGEVAELLRPYYLAYLREHDVDPSYAEEGG